jgi:sugar lactone lactonase YvrE
LAGALACLFAAGPAQAQQFSPHLLAGTFEGSDSTGGAFGEVRDIAADQQSGDVYVLSFYGGALKLAKFNAQGVATPFSDPSLGGSTVLTITSGEVGETSVAVDNSNQSTQGRIYVSNAAGAANAHTYAYEPGGKPVGGKFPISAAGHKISVDPTTGLFWMTGVHLVGHITSFTPDGTETATELVVVKEEEPGENYGMDIGAEGNIYTFTYPDVIKLDQSGNILNTTHFEIFGGLATNQVNGDVIYVASGAHELDSKGDELPAFEFEGGFYTSLAINGANGYVYVSSGNSSVSIFEPGSPVTLPDVETGQPSNIGPTSVQLNATVNPDGVETTKCEFEYGPTLGYGTTAPCDQGEHLTGSSPLAVSASPSGLTQGATYHYRLVLANSNAAPNNTLRTKDQTFQPSAPPAATLPFVTEVHSDSARFHDEITPEGAPTTYHVLYGTADCATEPGACSSTQESSSVGSGLNPVTPSTLIAGLEGGTTYNYIFVATNQSGTTESEEQTFTTFPATKPFEDACPNAHVRQQTGAALLPDCRAYELASASDQNGYDVESYLVEGQEPFGGYPEAEGPSRVLYGVHDGAIPGTGHPTNHGLDPYVATRGATGWSTKYVGIPADLPYSAESFASPLRGADAALNTFAFGGPSLCSPCFSDGSTGIPVTLPDGSLAQGMTGPRDPGTSATPNMLVKKSLSAGGTHIIFGSISEFETGAGSPAIYDRDLATGVTHAVSKLPGGGPIPCLMQCESDGLAELDVSADGSRIVIGQLLGTDSAGNHYWHLYMNVGDSAETIDLTPGASEGALYDGMTGDGSKVYLTTADRLTGQDTDNSTDLYRADVAGSGATLTLVSIGGGNGNSDSCDPIGNSVDTHWNSTEPAANCGVVAVGGGGGVAAAEGSSYFLSPELLDGSSEPEDGVADAPNLYLASPGSAPRFVATLESSLTGPNPPVQEHRYTGSFAASQAPKFVAVDDSGGPSDGDVYVADTSTNVVRKFDSNGNLITSWGNGGVLSGHGSTPFLPISGLAVGADGTLYVGTFTELNGEVGVFEYDQAGALTHEVAVEGAIQPIGISVDNAGRIYYVGYSERVMRFTPGKGSTSISTWYYESGTKSGVAVDPSSGDLYVGLGGESIGRFHFDNQERVVEAGGATCESNCKPSEVFGKAEVEQATGMAVDPTTGDLYVDEGNRILRFNKKGRRVAGPLTGADVLSHSTSVALSSAGDLYATNTGSTGADVAAFGPLVLAADPRTDNPLVVDSVNEADTRHTGDFQVTPNGAYAAFLTTIPFSGFNDAGNEEVFRYGVAGEDLTCVSCNPTGAIATGEGRLAPNGLSLTEDGRVFFDSTEALAPRDLDGREDVYEWENGEINLISTGISPYSSSLLSASADGTDVYFFTRDVLAPQDTNGNLVKVYDARSHGGFPYTPPPNSCKASDECHGPGTVPGPSPGIRTITGSRGNEPTSPTKRCRRGHVRRHGHCVKKATGNKRHRRHVHKRGQR